MANIKMGAIVADIRGSIAGTTFSRTGGGAIARNNPKPCNPRSVLQASRRAALSLMSTYWSKTLTPAQREAWADYASGTSWTNKVGTQALISGLAAFVRLNTLIRIQWGVTPMNPVPSEWELRADGPIGNGHAGSPSFSILANPTGLAITINQPSLPWHNNINGERMLLFCHTPVAAGADKPGSQRQYMGYLEASSGVPEVFPHAAIATIPFVAGQRVFVTGIFLDANYHVGADYTASVIAAVP